MTPHSCLLAPPAELAPIVAEIMGRPWRVDRSGSDIVQMVNGRPGARMNPNTLQDAFLLQSRVAELGLQEKFCTYLMGIATPLKDMGGGMMGFDDFDSWFALATATPLQRTRAAVAAYIESKEPK